MNRRSTVNQKYQYSITPFTGSSKQPQLNKILFKNKTEKNNTKFSKVFPSDEERNALRESHRSQGYGKCPTNKVWSLNT